MNPPLPEPVIPPRLMVEPKGINGALYTEAQLLAYRAEVIELCANAIHEIPRNGAWVTKVEAIEALEKLK